MGRVIEALGSGVVVYVIVAACAGADGGGRTGGGGGAVATGGGAGGAAAGGGGIAGSPGSGATGGTSGTDASEDSPFDAIFDALTDPVPDAKANESGTRLKAKRRVASDGAKQWIAWHDSQRKEDCYFQLAEDGVWRCMPSSGGGGSYYSDAGCSQLVATFATQPVCLPKYMYEATSTSAACGPETRYKAHALGAKLSLADLYVKSGAQCTKQAVPAGYAIYATSPVPASEFVSAVDQID